MAEGTEYEMGLPNLSLILGMVFCALVSVYHKKTGKVNQLPYPLRFFYIFLLLNLSLKRPFLEIFHTYFCCVCSITTRCKVRILTILRRPSFQLGRQNAPALRCMASTT